MKNFSDIINPNQQAHHTHPTAQVIDLQEEKKLEGEAIALVELHDFIKAHPDGSVKDIARFMPPVDSRVVSKAIQMIALREEAAKKAGQDKNKAAQTPVHVPASAPIHESILAEEKLHKPFKK